MPTSRGSRYLPGLVALGAWLLVSQTAEAHFVLSAPAASTEQNGLGDPQKAPPCGDDGTATLTGEVTTYQAGDTITITIDERIYHPGHYRIALVADIADMPEPPPVTPADTPCGSAPIDPAPQFPVLADGVFEHTEPFSEPQTIEVTIPEDLSCENCTLQVIQFMSDHALNVPGGCYYHHCATIEVQEGPVTATSSPGDDTGPSTDDGPSDTTEAGGTATPGDTNGGDATANATSQTSDAPTPTVTGATSDDDDSGCSCSASNNDTGQLFGAVIGLLGLLGLRLRRRRQQQQRHPRSDRS